MRTGAHNGGKWAGFALGLGATAAALGQGPDASLRGMVTLPDGRPAAGAAVGFHAPRVLGLAGLRADAETVEVVTGRADADGRFALDLPAGLAGTCIATLADDLAVATAVVAGPGLLRLVLEPARTRRIRCTPPTAGAFEVGFEGPSPLARRRIEARDGVLDVPLLPGLGSVLLAPPGFLAPSGEPWLPGSGYDRERLPLRAAPLRPLAVRWVMPRAVPGARRGPLAALWHGGDALGVGQLAGGTPFAAHGERIVCLPEQARLRRVAVPAATARVVLVAIVTLPVGDDAVAFSVAQELARVGTWTTLPPWLPADAPFLLAAESAAGAFVIDAEADGPAQRVRGRVRDALGGPAGGVTVRVRRPGSGPTPVLEVTSGPDGSFELPLRLPRGDYACLARARDGRQRHVMFAVGDGDVGVDVALPGGAALRGVVVDADGEPATGVRVELLVGRDEHAAGFGWPERCTFTDRAGEFAFAGLDEGAPYEIAADSAAFGGVVANGAVPGDEPVLLQLRAAPAPR